MSEPKSQRKVASCVVILDLVFNKLYNPLPHAGFVYLWCPFLVCVLRCVLRWRLTRSKVRYTHEQSIRWSFIRPDIFLTPNFTCFFLKTRLYSINNQDNLTLRWFWTKWWRRQHESGKSISLWRPHEETRDEGMSKEDWTREKEREKERDWLTVWATDMRERTRGTKRAVDSGMRERNWRDWAEKTQCKEESGERSSCCTTRKVEGLVPKQQENRSRGRRSRRTGRETLTDYESHLETEGLQ